MSTPEDNDQPIFDDKWLKNARTMNSNASWANAVVESLETSGQKYLATFRLWFNEFPAPPNDKQKLRERLECFQNNQHLGGVNELAWWIFMQRENLMATVVPTTKKASRPDFQLKPPADCFIEITTLNISVKDRQALNHDETIRRVIGKLTDEKLKQLMYAADQKKSGVLVIFDYSEWSAFGTNFFNALGEFLLGTKFGFKDVLPELSAIIYMERKVDDGRIKLSGARSAVYYNPLACYPLLVNCFPLLNQFRYPLASSERSSTEPWIYLCKP